MAALFLLNSLTIGGSERKIVRVANALRQAGHDIHLAYLSAPHTLRAELDPELPAIHLNRSGKFSLAAVTHLKRYIIAQNISHVACVNLYPLLYAKAVAWQLGKRAPIISTLVNTTDFHSLKDELQMLLYAPLLRRTASLVFGCRLQQQQWCARYGLAAASSRVIYNGVDQSHFSPEAVTQTREQVRKHHGFSADAFIAITVGQLRPEKRQTDLIRAVAAVSSRGQQVHVLVVGEGVCRGEIERCIVDLGVRASVHLMGVRADVRPFLMAADVFVLSSIAVETFSNAALEAMAMGLPVVLSRVGGAAEMVEAGRNGFLFSPGNVDELAGHIAALAGDKDLTRKMGLAATSRIRDSFSFTKMVAEYRSLLFPRASKFMPSVEKESVRAYRQLTGSQAER